MRVEKVIGFVDWNTAIISSGAMRNGRDIHIAELTLKHIERIISEYLIKLPNSPSYQVRLRLYAGWWQGKTPTGYRRGIERLRKNYGKRERTYGKCVFQGGDSGLETSDKMARVGGRLARKQGVHFLDMVRQDRDQKREKMVDTCLIADLLDLARRNEADRYVIVSDDDDMFPGMFSAEAIGAQIKLLSRPKKSSRYMAHGRDLIYIYESVPS